MTINYTFVYKSGMDEYLSRLVAHYKTQANAAKAVGLSPQAVSQFRARGRIPVEWQIRWELDTGGAIKAPDLPDSIRTGVAA